MSEILEELSHLEDEHIRAGYVMEMCALRFKGYEWATSTSGKVNDARLRKLSGEVARSLACFPDAEENFAAFFYLQRHFRQSGMGFLAYPDDSLCRAAAFLFLELKQVPPPERWADAEYCQKWARFPKAEQEKAAAAVRRWIVESGKWPSPEPCRPVRKSGDEIRVTVDGGEFYSFLRAMKRGYRAQNMGEVVMTVRDGKLTVETARGGVVLRCEKGLEVTARLTPGDFVGLVSLKDAKFAGPLTIAFRPKLGEVGLPHAGTKAKFD